jgi:hypothetical protein
MLRFIHVRCLLPALAAAMVAAPGGAFAEPVSRHTSKFDIWFTALKVAPLIVGKASFDYAIEGEKYRMALYGETAGIVSRFEQGDGVSRSSGAISSDGVRADRHFARYTSPKKTSKLNMTFRNGDVAKVEIRPKSAIRKKKGPKWIKIGEDDLKSVIDPASSILVPVAAARASDGKAVCDRTLRVYDGDTRFDMTLAYKATKPVKTEGYQGDAFVCSLRYTPVSGHETGQKNIEYMSANKGMEIWMAPMAAASGDNSLFSPIRVFVPTWVGNFTAEPSYFGPSRK